MRRSLSPFVRSHILHFEFLRSLGVLLYTLVYGAMPFDGSNFKRLVKQITTGDYYEPKKPAGIVFQFFQGTSLKIMYKLIFIQKFVMHIKDTDIISDF